MVVKQSRVRILPLTEMRIIIKTYGQGLTILFYKDEEAVKMDNYERRHSFKPFLLIVKESFRL